jgi:hypothetical protein
MCEILYLKAGVMPVEEEFTNMCHNNWHSYGLVTLVDGKMDIKKKVPTGAPGIGGEIDPSELWALLEDDIQYDRFVHVRHNTAGATTLENCHPFDVFYSPSNGRQIVFMHNGTMYEYKSVTYSVQGVKVDDNLGPSDTQNFVNRVLVPYLSGLDFGNGHGDLEDQRVVDLIKKFFPATGNRGLLISSDQKPVFLGDWKKTQGSKGEEIICANADYFKKVLRGPEQARREARLKELEAQQKATASSTKTGGSTTGQEVVPFTLFNFPTPNKVNHSHGVFHLKESLKGIISDYNIWDRNCAVALGAATHAELKELASVPETAACLMDWIFADYATMYEELGDTEEKLKRATMHIATMQEELKDLRNAMFPKKETKVG